MLNTTNQYNKVDLNFNSVSGTLVKSCNGSRFIRFAKDSEYAAEFFDLHQPHYLSGRKKVPIEVLQVMLCGEGQFLVEYIDKK